MKTYTFIISTLQSSALPAGAGIETSLFYSTGKKLTG